MRPLKLVTLGELRLLDGEQELLPGRRKNLVLLTYLAWRSPRGVSRAELASLLWSDRPEPRARHSLRQALHDLRGAAGAVLELSDDTVRLVPGALVWDLAQLESELASGRLEKAAERWGGDFLQRLEGLGGEEYRAWVEAERQRGRRLVAGALDRLAEKAGTSGEWNRARLWAQRWTEIEPYSERAHTRLIEALRLAGRPDAAAAALDAFRTRLCDELGEEPSAELMLVAAAGEPRRYVPEPAATSPHSAALSSPDLVGRGTLFAQLTDAWREVEQGEGVVIVVGGEKGMGKTRLCEEFLHWLGQAGSEALVLRARAYEAERHVPWAVTRDLLSTLGGAPGLGGAPDDALAALSRLAPDIRDRFPRLPVRRGDEEQVSSSLVRVLADIAAECPVILFLDDFPAADEPSRRTLMWLARRLPERLLLIVTGPAYAESFDPTFDPLRELQRVRWLKLPPLTVAETEAMLDSMLVLRPQQRHKLAVRVHAEGEGNPFYMTALVGALADAGHLAPDGSGIWRLTSAADRSPLLPVDTRDSVRARLENLNEGARQLIGAAAVLGRTLDTGLLEAVAAQPVDRFCEALEELVSRRLLRPAPGTQGYEFTHDLVRRATYALLSPARRRLLHGAALRTLEGLPGRDAERREAIRHHRKHAGRPSRHARGLRAAAFAAVGLAIAFVVSATLVRSGEGPAEITDQGRPVVAHRQFQEGLAAFHRADLVTADRFFTAALEEDSTYALAAYYAWRTRSGLGQRVSGDTVLTRALRWIEAAPEPERLLTRALWASALGQPSRFELAEALAVRYPLVPEGHFLLGRAKRARGDFLGAIPHLRQVIVMDSLGLEGLSIHCRACDAYREAIEAYVVADSVVAALRWAREWTERQPTSPRAWNTLSDLLLARGRFAEALAAKQTSLSLQPGSEMGPIFPAHLAIRAGDWATADSILRQAAEEATAEMRTSALWWLTISLREQGRLREALETAGRYRSGVSALHAATELSPRTVPFTAVIEAQVLFELGRFPAAAALFDSIAAEAVVPESRGWTARAQAWTLTHRATALAYAQDTLALAPLAERVRVIGGESGFGRDWRLHHYVRGLLLVHRGHTAEAEREFRQAIYSLPGGFSRINLELARTLLVQGRADEAVALLEAALRGPLEASGLYLTRTELHLELARALEKAGRLDRAAEHYRWVVQAWEHADPELQARRDAARLRLEVLGDGRVGG